MAELTKTDRDRGLTFAKKLRLFAWDAPFPSIESKVHRLVNEIERDYGYTPELKKLAIVKYIREIGGGNSSVPELVEHFGWHKDVVRHLIGELEAAKKIEYYDARPAGPSKKGRAARRVRIVGPPVLA